MRILHVASGDLWGGAEAQVFELLRELRGRTEVEVGSLLLNEGLLAERLRSIGVPTFVIEESGRSIVQLIREATTVMRAFGPAVVHTHRLKEHLVGVVASRLCGARGSVRTVHGSEESAERGKNSRRRMAIQIDRQIVSRLQQTAVAVSGSLANECREQLRCPEVRVIENGVAVADIVRRAQEAGPVIDDRRICLCAVGRLVPVKRIDVMLETMRVLEDWAPGAYSLRVIGDGPLKFQMMDMTRQLNLTDQVTFMGFVENPLPIVNQMDALLLTSDHEGLPIVALEALSLGVPVVAHAVGGLRDLLGAAAFGELVSSQDPRAMAEAVTKRLPRGSQYRDDRSSLLPVQYHIAATAGMYLDIYRAVAGGSRNGG